MLKNIIWHKINRKLSLLKPQMQHQVELSNIVSIWKTIEDYLTIITLFQVHGNLARGSACKVIQERPSEYFCQLFIIVIFISEHLLKNLIESRETTVVVYFAKLIERKISIFLQCLRLCRNLFEHLLFRLFIRVWKVIEKLGSYAVVLFFALHYCIFKKIIVSTQN